MRKHQCKEIETIRIVRGEDDLELRLMNGPGGPILLVSGLCIEGLQEILQLILDTSPDETVSDAAPSDATLN